MITVTDEFLLLDSSCKMQDDLCGSDHFPIIVDSLIFTVGESPTWHKFDKADWSLYEQMLYDNMIVGLIYIYVRRVWRYQRGNQNPYIEEQTTQWSNEKVQKDK